MAVEFCPSCGTALGMTDSATQPKIDFCMPLRDMLDVLDAHVEMPPVSRRDVVIITPEHLAELEAVVDAARAVKGVLEQVQAVWLPDSHNVRVVLAKLADTLDVLKEKE